MWVNSKEAAEILGVNSKSLIQAIYRAKKFCSIKCNILPFTRINGRGGASGKILQIWIDDSVISNKKGETDAINTNESGEKPSYKVASGEEPSQGLNKTNAGTNIGIYKEYAEQGLSSSGNANGSVWLKGERGLSDGNIGVDIVGGDSSCLLISDTDSDSCGIDGKRNLYRQEIANKETLLPNPINIKIKDIENMNRVKAVTDLNSCPKGFSKTLWGKQIAQKHGVSLKTLYNWVKCLKSDEVKIKDDELSIDFKASFKSSSFEMSALEWAVGFMLHNPLSSKTFT